MEHLSELRRSTSDGKVAGVCVMLADQWRIDPLLVRVAALLLALSSGIGMVLYAAAWALIPPQGSDRAPIDAVFPGVRKLGRTALAALLLVVCVFAAALVGHWVPFGIGPALVIGAVWYFGWYRPEQQRRAARPTAPGPPQLADRPFTGETPFTEAAAAWQRRVQDYLQDHADPVPPAPLTAAHDPGYSLQAFLTYPDPVGLFPPSPPATQPSPPATPPSPPGTRPSPPAADRSSDAMTANEPEFPAQSEAADPTAPFASTTAPVAERTTATTTVETPSAPPKRPRRRTGRLHLIGWTLTLICVGTVAILDRSSDLPFFAYPAAALLAIGLTLVLGAWLPRPRGLVIVGALLGVLIGVSTVPLPEGPTTEVTYSSVADLPAVMKEEDAGTILADLSALRLDGDATYAVGVDVGRIAVQVPPDTNVRILWSVDVGEADILGLPTAYGVDLRDTTFRQGSDADGPTLTIEARVGLGQLEVKR